MTPQYIEGAISIISLLMLIWYVVVFFSPFVLISIGKKLDKMILLQEQQMLITRGMADEIGMSRQDIADKYGIESTADGWKFDVKLFDTLDQAITYARNSRS